MRRLIHTQILVLAGIAMTATACDAPPVPTDSARPAEAPAAAPAAALSQIDRQERLARRLAVTLGQPGRRQALLARFGQATGVERKVHFQALLAAERGAWRQALAEAGSGGEAALGAELELGALEVYLPDPGHRNRWAGGADLLVATAVEDGAPPIAFDVTGRRFLLDPAHPPERPVIALVPAAHNGIAVLDIISPCVTFNNQDNAYHSYAWGKDHEEPLHDITYIAPRNEIILEEEMKEGEVREVSMHDGSVVVLKNLSMTIIRPTVSRPCVSLPRRSRITGWGPA